MLFSQTSVMDYLPRDLMNIIGEYNMIPKKHVEIIHDCFLDEFKDHTDYGQRNDYIIPSISHYSPYSRAETYLHIMSSKIPHRQRKTVYCSWLDKQISYDQQFDEIKKFQKNMEKNYN